MKVPPGEFQAPPGNATSLTGGLLATTQGMISMTHLAITQNMIAMQQKTRDHQSIMQLLQQGAEDFTTISHMEETMIRLQADQLQAEEDRRAQDAHTRHVIQIGVDGIHATKTRMPTNEANTDAAPEIAATHIQQLMAQAEQQRRLHHATNKRLDHTQSVVHESHNTNTTKIEATQAAVIINAHTSQRHVNNVKSAT
jgi:hypothetical protein